MAELVNKSLYWVIGILSAVVGILIVAFKMQGQKLHFAQVQLLAARIAAVNEKDQNKVLEANKKFAVAYKEYLDASKTMP